MSKEQTPTGIFARVTPGVKRSLEALAAKNKRSLGAEAAVAIETYLLSNGPAAPSEQDLGSRAATKGA